MDGNDVEGDLAKALRTLNYLYINECDIRCQMKGTSLLKNKASSSSLIAQVGQRPKSASLGTDSATIGYKGFARSLSALVVFCLVTMTREELYVSTI